jgi:TatD DNase family protein
MIMADTHAHLYLEEFREDLHEVVMRAAAAGVRHILLPNIDKGSISGMMALEASYPGLCFPMMGLHPTSVKEDYCDQLKIVEDWLARRPFQAVGEIGIDLYWDKTFRREQEDAFVRQVRLARQYGYPIAIHTRNSMEETIAILEGEPDQGPGGVFHCFTGTVRQAEKVTRMGYCLGIGGVLTYKNSGLEEVVAAVGLEYILLETDAPFLAPVPYRGKRNESAFVRLVAERIAGIRNIPAEEVATVTTANAIRVFRLPETPMS